MPRRLGPPQPRPATLTWALVRPRRTVCMAAGSKLMPSHFRIGDTLATTCHPHRLDQLTPHPAEHHVELRVRIAPGIARHQRDLVQEAGAVGREQEVDAGETER